MNTIDLLILLWAITAAVRGVRIGLLRQLFSFGGFFGGLFIGGWIAPHLAQYLSGSAGRLVGTIVVTFGMALALSAAAERLAIRLQHPLTQNKVGHHLNRNLGIVFSVMAVLITSWLIAAALNRLPLANLGLQISNSRLISAVDRIMPPAPVVMERLGRLISPQGFPEVFVGREPRTPPIGAPVAEEVAAAAEAARASTVKIESLACGGVSVGSGFVVHPNYVVTNAHVVAGARAPVVLDENGRHRATVVWFDPGLDFAVLRTDNLAGPPLALATDVVEPGRSAAVLGYPGGGGLQTDGATILGNHQALGRDIYDRNISVRDIYELQTSIEQGNSGGPVVLPDGTVAGVVFAVSAEDQSYAYALTAQAIAEDLAQALTTSNPTSTGPCTL